MLFENAYFVWYIHIEQKTIKKYVGLLPVFWAKP